MKFPRFPLCLTASLLLLSGCGGNDASEAGQTGPDQPVPSQAATEAAAPEMAAATPSLVASSKAAEPPAVAAAQPSASGAPVAKTSADARDYGRIAENIAPPAAFTQCRSCHSVEPGQNGIGPSLHGVFGKQAASVAGYTYSPALRESGIIWRRDTLEQWLAAPMKMVPGTKMVLGARSADQREAIIDYLETLK